MFLLQLQLYVLTIIRVTLRRIQKPFRRKSTFCKFKYTVLSKEYKESHRYKLTGIVANESYTDQLYLYKNTLKQTKFQDKTVKSTQLSLVLVSRSF